MRTRIFGVQVYKGHMSDENGGLQRHLEGNREVACRESAIMAKCSGVYQCVHVSQHRGATQVTQ